MWDQCGPQEAPAISAALGVVQAGWWTQRVANKAGASEHPCCLKCEPAVLCSARHRLWACPAYRETRFDLLPTHQHQGETATGDKLKWERGLMHDFAEKCIPGRTHDVANHVWVHHSIVGNSLEAKLFVDGSLTCKHGARDEQTGWAVAQINEATGERRTVPCRSRFRCNAAACGQNSGPRYRP